MIRGVHGLLYSSDPEATRAFFRNQVKLVGSDAPGGGWTFDFAVGDLAVRGAGEGAPAGKHDVCLYCDDIHGTVASMKSRGVKFTHAVMDQGHALVTYFRAPGGLTVELVEPKAPKVARKSPAAAAKPKKTPAPRAKAPGAPPRPRR